MAKASIAHDPTLYSTASDDHGTPTPIVELARELGNGGIDLDPFSSSYWNHHSVRALRFYDREHSGFAPENPFYGHMLLNPPGYQKDDEINGKNPVRDAWDKLVASYRDGRVTSCLWVGFSLEQLTYLQNGPMHPLQFLTSVPIERQEFLRRVSGAPPVKGTAPRYGNYLSLLPDRRSPALARYQISIFRERCSAIGNFGGAVVRPC